MAWNVFGIAQDFKKLARIPVRPVVACVKFSTDNTFAATVVKKQI
jgi:hypothetical protein